MNLLREWLVADGLGGYAMGTDNGYRTRRYHGLLLVASPHDERRYMLVNGVEAWIDRDGTSVPLNSHKYRPDTVYPKRVARIAKYSTTPWPAWTLEWAGGVVEHEICGVHGNAATVLRWVWRGEGKATLRVRLQLSGRDWHALHRENTAFRFESESVPNGGRRFTPYADVPPVVACANAKFRHAPLWFRNFQLDEERERGQEFIEDLASPGEFAFELTPDNPEAVLVVTTSPDWGGMAVSGDVRAEAKAVLDRERSRVAGFESPMERIADQFIVTRGKRRTIIAGYPWFTDWGRDTFIALRGLCIAMGRRADAEAILLSWCEHVSQGMMPNLFPSGNAKPEYNSVDASLWFVIAVSDLTSGPVRNVPLPFIQAIEDILTHYSRGTRHGIRMDKDGLLAAGEPGYALTWMDAVVDGVPVTPRIGKPVEVQALWINALEFASTWNKRWASVAARARESFVARFWNEKRQCLYDVVDVDHVPGAVDDRIRPNQIFACGGLPSQLLDVERTRSVIKLVASKLESGIGLRSLAPGEPGYIGRADGPLRQRDLAYHQGTTWLWLSAAMWDAIASDDDGHALLPEIQPPAMESMELEPDLPSPEILAQWNEAAESEVSDFPPFEIPEFPEIGDVKGLMRHTEAMGLLNWEIADGDSPHMPRGCPFQAWSVGEYLRKRKSMESSI